MARIIVADAGPLIAFAGVGQLELLRILFGEVVIPQSVKDECLAKPGEDAALIQQAITQGWLAVQQRPDQPEPLSPVLGPGESDAIRIGQEDPQNTLLIMDDRLARRYALKRGLPLIGTARLLDIAEQRGLLGSAEDCIQAMAERGYRISTGLLVRIRQHRKPVA